MICEIDDKFKNVEKLLYTKYPEIKKKGGCYFICNGIALNKSATLRENNIKNGDTILANYIYDEEIERNEDYIAIDFIYNTLEYAMVCHKDDNIYNIKERLYDEIPQLKGSEFFFLYNGILLSNKEKTLRDNYIKNGDKILIVGIDDDDEKDNFINERNEEYIIVHFISTDQTINNALRCNKFDKFYIIENELYNKFPNFKTKKCFFLGNGGQIDSHKTLEENKILNGDKLIVVTNEDEDE